MIITEIDLETIKHRDYVSVKCNFCKEIRKMKILIACEFSGIVREAFRKKGHDVWSCDLLETETPGNHIQADVLNHLDEGWDMMIAHPPCQYLSYAGIRHWNKPGREKKRAQALDFLLTLWHSNIYKICIENPVGCFNSTLKPSQIIHPYYFGDPELKRTCLWLKNLPKLVSIKTDDLFLPITHVPKPKPYSVDRSGKKRYFTDGKNRNPHHRAKTFPSIAAAMAEQWK